MPPATPTQIVTEAMIGPYTTTPVPAGNLAIAFTAADPVNGNFFYFDYPKGDLIIAHNTDYTATHYFTLYSVPDIPFDRTGDISEYAVPAGTLMIYNLNAATGWGIVIGPTPTSYQVDIQADSAALQFAIIQLQ
jgi:hypothetical protein